MNGAQQETERAAGRRSSAGDRARSGQVGRATVVRLGAALVATSSLVGPLTAATPPIRTASPVITGSQIPPPPAHLLPLLPRFYILLHGYLALDGASKLSFPAWVFLNGVTDPVVLAGMSELYEWYLSGSSHRARRDR